MQRKASIFAVLLAIVLVLVSCIGMAQATAEQPSAQTTSVTGNVYMQYGTMGKGFVSPWSKHKYVSTTQVYDPQTKGYTLCQHAGCMKIITLRGCGCKGMRYIAFKSKSSQQVISASFGYINRFGTYTYSSTVWGGIPVATSIKVTVDGFAERMRLYYANVEVYDPALAPPVFTGGGSCTATGCG